MVQSTSKADRFKRLVGVDVPAEPSRGRTMEKVEGSPEPVGLDADFEKPAPKGMSFVPILAAAKLPYKYIPRRFSEDVAKKFFAGGKFWTRSWDLYFVWSPYCPHIQKPYIFVPLQQLQALIKDIDKTFPNWHIMIPVDAEETGLVVNFGDHPELRPRWLGHSKCKYDYEFLESSTRPSEMSASSPPLPDEIQSFQEFMEAAIDATKQRSKAAKLKKKEDRVIKQQDMVRSFKRAQRYLGLHSRTTSDDGLSRTASPEPRPIEVEKPVPFNFDCDVIFIAIDAEAYEHNHSMVTELGVATLDTRDLTGIAPGHNGWNWRKHIRARHFRIDEHRHMLNRNFVHGCEEYFDFGKSEFISIHDAPRVMASCFKPPYSEVGADTEAYGSEAEKRNIIFLGHDTQQDVAYLKQIGYDINNLSTLLETQDTSTMYRAFTQEINPRNLGHVCQLLDIEAWHMHNAGNDAVYTVQAMLGLCVKDAVENRGDAKLERSRERIARLEEEAERAKKLAEEKVREDVEGWELPEEDDGGVPLHPKDKHEKDLAQSMSGLRLTAGGRILDV